MIDLGVEFCGIERNQTARLDRDLDASVCDAFFAGRATSGPSINLIAEVRSRDHETPQSQGASEREMEREIDPTPRRFFVRQEDEAVTFFGRRQDSAQDSAVVSKG